MIALIVLSALAAEEPCTGHVAENRVDSEHFWVEWDGDVITTHQAEDIALYAEQARTVFVDELGWPLTERAILYEVIDQGETGIGGFAQTEYCSGEPVPRIELYVGEYTDAKAANVTAHELAHGAEYGFMGDYLDSVQSWLWFMEGTATWLAYEVDGNADLLGDDVEGYLEQPELALHHDLGGFLDGSTTRHMYGTAWLAGHITEEYGADALTELWATGAVDTGTLLYFPDVAADSGLAFGEAWPRFLAGAAAGEARWGGIGAGATPLDTVEPGEAGATDELAPQGLGMSVIAFRDGRRRKALEVTFDGDAEVEWVVVLVRAQAATVLDYVPLAVEDGHAQGWLTEFLPYTEAYLVASPVEASTLPRAFEWSSAWGDDREPMDGLVSLAEPEPPAACGCGHGGGAAGWLALLPLLALCRRGQPRAASQA